MIVTLKRRLLCLGCAAGLLLAGCAKKPPPVTDVEGRVLLNGQPLPLAQVEFVPELKGFGAEMNSVGTTDEQGYFKLTCNFNGQPGAVVGTHRVLITEAPVPAEMRGERAQDRLAAYTRSLKNRPIPDKYGNVTRTPVRVEVKPDQKTYEITLQR